MKIVHAIFSSGFGGSERSAAELCNALARRHEVLLAVQSRHRDANGASIIDAVDPRVRVVEIGGWFRRARLAALLRRERPAAVHAHLGRASRVLGNLRGPWPRVATLHIEYRPKDYARLDALVCLTDAQRERIGPEYSGRVFLVPHGFAPVEVPSPTRIAQLRRALHLSPDRYVIGGVGRLHREKRFDLLIEAFRKAKLDNAVLMIVGDGEEMSSLRKLEGPDVRLLGFRSNARELLHAFDAFALASRHEAFGLVLLEAMAAGLPIVATRTPGAEAVLAGTSARLVPVDDAAALSAALRDLRSSGRRHVVYDLSRFDLDNWSRRIESVYQQLSGHAWPEEIDLPAEIAT